MPMLFNISCHISCSWPRGVIDRAIFQVLCPGGLCVMPYFVLFVMYHVLFRALYPEGSYIVPYSKLFVPRDYRSCPILCLLCLCYLLF